MNSWNDPLRARLDALESPIHLFFRDDDVGPSDQRLYRLLDLFGVYQVPIDLAAIPDTLEAAVARLLLGLHEDQPSLLGIHQHGFRHSNHARSGRKCEFGPDRGYQQQASDITAGQQRLQEALGSAIDPIFTPPWNRCTQMTADALKHNGFAMLSRNVGAETLMLDPLQNLDVSVDWCKTPRPEPASLLRAIDASAANQQPLGVMLHHAVMHEESFDTLEQVLHVIARHPKVRCSPMREFISTSANAAELCAVTNKP